MFDLDESGSLELSEFEKVMKKQKGKPTGPPLELRGKARNLLTHLFGQLGEGALTLQQFTNFMATLQQKVSKAQFDHYSRKGKISGHSLVKLVVANANLLPEFIPALETLPENLRSTEVSLKEYLLSMDVLKNLKDVDAALKLTASHHQQFSKTDFSRAVNAVVGPGLSPLTIDILFHILDSEGRGSIGRAELIRMVARQAGSASEKEKPQGMRAKLSDFIHCVKHFE